LWDRALLIEVARSENTFGAYGEWFYWPAISFLAVLPALVLFWWGALAEAERVVLIAGGALLFAFCAIVVGAVALREAIGVIRDFRPHMARVRAALDAAADPRVGWAAFWGAVRTSFIGIALPPILGTAVLRQWLGRGFWADLILGLAALFGVALVSALLEIRLYRLLAPPSTPSWVRCGVVVLPLAAAAWIFWKVSWMLRSVPDAAPSAASTWFLATFVPGLVAALCYAIAEIFAQPLEKVE
jgi:hypothetical protein